MKEMLTTKGYLRALNHLLHHPKGTLRYGYLYVREMGVNREARISELLDIEPKIARGFLEELHRSPLLREFKTALEDAGRLPAAGMTSNSRGPVLYAICRALKPLKVVETGVSSGVSSSYILEALQMNDTGKLHSIDYPDEHSPRTTGWLIPNRLRSRWALTVGKSSTELEPILRAEHQIDLFLHDSDHSYENMIFEFRKAWPYLRAGGLLLSDDTNMNNSFRDFAAEVSHTKVSFYALGGIRK